MSGHNGSTICSDPTVSLFMGLVKWITFSDISYLSVC